MKIVVWSFAALGVTFALLLTHCTRSPTIEAPPHQMETKLMETEQQWHDGAEAIFILANQAVIQTQKHPPDGFYVKGVLENGVFRPKTGVLGIGELATDGRYGWLELNSKEFFPMESDRRALTPFVKGYMTDRGFMPSVREVFDEP